ncbi:uncharacterized protein CXorf38 isoform X2 [Genypterus blacodes]|uniref:uncharacterized protein CXorf38 isoform X2 n=1 Tax=Genypterus blacodes TaxID=154954 RepID=UPI003F76D2B4
MEHEELVVRLNDNGYTNWLKAGRCLLLLKEGLHPYIDHQMRAFHGDLINQNPLLRKLCQVSCRPKGNKLSYPCEACSLWQRVILKHHRQSDATVNWDNCFPPSWRVNHWEVAKAYMPRGQVKVKGADQCDASALLNLINHCDNFFVVNQKFVREVIRCRNELMHSCELRVTDAWMKHYRMILENLMKQFSHIPEMAMAAQQINKMLTVKWSICISGLDHTDAARLEGLQTDSVMHWEVGTDSISQWEAELLRESLQDLLSSDDDDTEAVVRRRNTLMSLGGFLQANRDLGEQFSTELQAINSLLVKV